MSNKMIYDLIKMAHQAVMLTFENAFEIRKIITKPQNVNFERKNNTKVQACPNCNCKKFEIPYIYIEKIEV